MEQWKDIYFEDKGVIWDYRGLYQVSDEGNIRSLDYNHTGKIKLLKQNKKKTGYKEVALPNIYNYGNQKFFLVHRLVAFMFIENDDPVNKVFINHKDENKSNNNVDNLEWCTRSYNTLYGTCIERMQEKTRNKASQSIAIIAVNINNSNDYIIFPSAGEAQRNGIAFKTNINKCCKLNKNNIKIATSGKNKDGDPYTWYYLTDYIIKFKQVFTE